MNDSNEKALDCLRQMKDPVSQQDIVSLGLVEHVEVERGLARVQLTPPVTDAYQHEALAEAIRRTLGGIDGISEVSVKWEKSTGQCGCQSAAPDDAAVSLPVLQNGSSPQLDDLNAGLNIAGVAPGAGYGEGGPEQIPSPELSASHHRYEGWPPVFQWDIDPADESLESGEEHVRIDDWEYEIWWQTHPSDVVYAALQALHDDPVTGGPERQHPIGRNVVVNLVYDRRREAVVAVYGTARDFRPFIEAFRIGCGLERQSQEQDA